MSDVQAILSKKDVNPRKTNVDMSVYRYYYRWGCWGGFWENIKQWFRNKHSAKMRARKGYCYSDIWNCGDHILEYIIATLVEYRNGTYGYPSQHFESFEKWIEYIDKIIDLLEYSTEDLETLNQYQPIFDAYIEDKTNTDLADKWFSVKDKYFEENNSLYQSQVDARKKALTMFAEYSDCIWW